MKNTKVYYCCHYIKSAISDVCIPVVFLTLCPVLYCKLFEKIEGNRGVWKQNAGEAVKLSFKQQSVTCIT